MTERQTIRDRADRWLREAIALEAWIADTPLPDAQPMLERYRRVRGNLHSAQRRAGIKLRRSNLRLLLPDGRLVKAHGWFRVNSSADSRKQTEGQ